MRDFLYLVQAMATRSLDQCQVPPCAFAKKRSPQILLLHRRDLRLFHPHMPMAEKSTTAFGQRDRGIPDEGACRIALPPSNASQAFGLAPAAVPEQRQDFLSLLP